MLGALSTFILFYLRLRNPATLLYQGDLKEREVNFQCLTWILEPSPVCLRRGRLGIIYIP